eukprot:Sspe_Gene.25279::Locus_10142_Transcript_7_10_Confidence_0.250_Length_533::g.25279::m.25279
MDCDVAASYKVERLQRDIHGEIEEAALIKTGLKKEFVWRSACPNPADLGLIGDNLLKKSDKMAWWKGQDVEVFVEKCVPILPISGWIGDNLLKHSEKMPWWKGQDVQIGEKGTEVLKITTLKEA